MIWAIDGDQLKSMHLKLYQQKKLILPKKDSYVNLFADVHKVVMEVKEGMEETISHCLLLSEHEKQKDLMKVIFYVDIYMTFLTESSKYFYRNQKHEEHKQHNFIGSVR